MIFSPPPRNLRPELLDLDEASFEEVRESLGDVRRVNRYLSGYRVLLQHSRTFLESHQSDQRSFTILDLATGSADQPIAVVDLARRLKVPVRVVALDINRKMLDYAREETRHYPEIGLVQGDIHTLPFGENSFDLVINSLSLHHFPRAEAVAILRSANFIGRRGFIINDLHRSRVAHAAIFVLTRLLTKNRLTRYDAPVSVMNAFTPPEMEEMAREAGIKQFKVHRHFPYRIALVGCKESS
ncbi:MAG: methyltransferase domain-containing protein [Nitrospinae bacterium]|nr:methyltransferase domain-containing protein [Nitrospinota bacterium]